MNLRETTEKLMAKIPEGKTISRVEIPKLIRIAWDNGRNYGEAQALNEVNKVKKQKDIDISDFLKGLMK